MQSIPLGSAYLATGIGKKVYHLAGDQIGGFYIEQWEERDLGTYHKPLAGNQVQYQYPMFFAEPVGLP